MPTDTEQPQRRSSEPAADESRRWRAIFNSAVDFAIVATDQDGRITDWNAGAERILGWSAAEMRGDTVHRFFTPEDRAGGRPEKEMRLSLEDGRAADERWHIRKDGSRFWASGEMMPLRDEAGGHIGYVKILRDFTDHLRERRHVDRLQFGLATLGDRLRTIDAVPDMIHAAAEIIGTALEVKRVGYGTLDDEGETFVVPHDWTAEGFPSLAGTYRLDDYGLYADDLRQGRTAVITDVWSDPRTAENPAPLAAVSVGSLINHPVVERGRTVAILYVNDPRARVWRDDEIAFVREAAGRLRQAVERRQAEQRIAEEAARQRLLLQQMPGFVAVLVGPEHVYEYINEAYVTISGPRDFIGRPVRAVFPELAGQGFHELLDQVYTSGNRFEARALPIRLAGENRDRFIDLLYQPIRDAAGTVTGIFVGGYDVSEQVRARVALAESGVRYRTLFESIDIGFCIIEMKFDEAGRAIDYRIAEANPAFERQTGANVAGLWVSEFAPNLERHWFDTYGQVALTGQPAHFENRADVFGRWFDVRALRLGDPAAHRVAIFFTDITERKSMEEALRQVNVSLEERVVERTAERDRLWQTTNDLMGTAGLDGNLKTINPAWGRMLGWNDDYLLSHPFAAIIDPADHAETADVVRRLAAGQTVSGFVDHVLAKDGSQRTVMWTAVPEEGTDLFYIVGRDITEQRSAEEALRQSQKMEAVGQLTGGIAHDFNNLLAGIAGSLELLGRRIGQGRINDAERYIAAAQGAASRAAALTHRLLAFSRRQTLDPKPTDIRHLVSGMEDLIRRTVGPEIRTEFKAADDLWSTLVDPPQLENALLNLCINARDAMPGGGELVVEAANRPLDERAARAFDLPLGEYLSLCVRDTGVGMPPEVIQKAFDPFFTTKPIGQGTGLGLSMVYGFARQSGGQVRIHSEVGRGTSICIYLPRHRGTAEAPHGTRQGQELEQAGAGETVLVVDDEPTVRMLVVEVLEELGYAAIEAGDGPSGLRIMESDIRIDLLVTDVGLPGGMNGRQMADAARVRRPQLKVLFITGYAETAAVGEGTLDAGMAVMTKPFAMDALAARIRNLIADG